MTRGTIVDCRSCGAENPGAARFCMSCGGSLEVARPGCATALPPAAARLDDPDLRRAFLRTNAAA